MPAPSLPLAPAWLVGLWRRETIIYSDGTEDRTTRVIWGQTQSLYVDLRIPADRPPTRGRRSFDDYTHEELLRLGDQMGFAGHVAVENDLCTWIRYIDFQPNTGRPDQGRLRLDGETLHERGESGSVLARDYHEIFHRERNAQRRCAALQSSSPIHHSDSDNAVLILIDDQFLFARGRSKGLPHGESLRELIVAARNDRSVINDYLDCEVSVGSIEESGDFWRVNSSTIPFREGQRLFSRSSAVKAAETSGFDLCSDSSQRHWKIIESSIPINDLVALFSR